MPRRSQLRFTPIATGKIEPWIIRCLIVTQGLLEKKENEAALAFCHEQLSDPASRPNSYDFFHRAVSLFTRHRDFASATSLYNRMIEEGFIILKKTNMVMLRGMHSHTAKQLEEVQDVMLRGAVQLDDLEFKAILDLMVLHRRPPQELEAALEAYAASRKGDWVIPISIFGTIIQSWALTGQLDRAEKWLDRYRRAWTPAMFQKRATTTSSSKGVVSERDNPIYQRFELKLRRRSGILVATEDPCYPYAAILMGYTKSLKPAQKRIHSLFQCLQLDGVTPDINMYNMLLPALVGWGLTPYAFKIFRSLLNPDTIPLPDAYTFRHLFIALNPKRPRTPYERAPPDNLSTRDLFNDMMKVVRFRLHTRKPQPHKNIISTATFNCALGTYCAQSDYAAAWTVLALFSRHHIPPDAKTSRIVTLSLLRRMVTEIEAPLDHVAWMDRFMGQHRSTMLETSNRMMLADRLNFIGRAAVVKMREEKQISYLKPSQAILGSTRDELEFLVALMRTALQASLGFTPNISQPVHIESAISATMHETRNAMIPRGRSERN